MSTDLAKRNLVDALGLQETDYGELIQRILATAPDCIKLVARDGMLLSMNEAGLDILKAPGPESLLGKCVYDLIALEDREIFISTVERAFNGVSSRVTFELMCFDGSRRFVEQRATPLTNHDGEVVAMLAVTTDVTKRVNRDEHLRQLQIAIENAMGGIARLDADGNYTSVQPGYARVLGRKPDEMIGQPWTISVPERMHEHTMTAYEEMLAQGRSETETIGLRADGTEFDKKLLLMRIDDMDGSLVGHYCLCDDITERKKREQEQERLERELAQSRRLDSIGRMAGGIAHDFNNMLEVILGYVDLARNRRDDEVSLLEFLDEIESAAQRSADLTSQLLSFSRKQPMKPTVVDLNDALEQMLKMLRRLIGESVELHWVPRGGIPNVEIDVTQLNQVLANLCLNARDAMYGGGSITIATDCVEIDAHDPRPFLPEGAYAVITVRDTGDGIPDEICEHIFEPFFTTKSEGKGTGLGLATVYGIVKQCEGYIDVKSKLGEGTEFTIMLPAKQIEQNGDDAATDEPERSASRGNETILLVEDEEQILALLEKLLTSLGYNVYSALQPSVALQLAQEHASEIDILVSDVVMPEMNGPELAGRLLDELPGLRVLFVSGYSMDSYDGTNGINPSENLLRKPFTLKQLAARVRETIAEAPRSA